MSPANVMGAVHSRIRNQLIVLGVVSATALIYSMWPAAGPKSAPSTQGRDARKPYARTAVSGSLETRLDDLKQAQLGSGKTTRNPFRFYVKPTLKPVLNTLPPLPPPELSDLNDNPTPLATIPLKFIGVAQQGTMKVAIFSDGTGLPVWASEGQTVLGLYKLLNIGVESVTMSYLDDSGLQRIPMRG
jgi:hypothetical protein